MKVTIEFDPKNDESVFDSVVFNTGAGDWAYAAELFIRSGECCRLSFQGIIKRWIEEEVIELEELERLIQLFKDKESRQRLG